MLKRSSDGKGTALLVKEAAIKTNDVVVEDSPALMTEYGSLDEGLRQPSPDASTPQSLGLGPSVG